MKKILYFILLTSIAGQGNSQILEKYGLKYNNAKYDIFIVKTGASLADKIEVIENDQQKPESELFQFLELSGKFFAVNAGIVDSSCNLLGLFINHFQKKQDINLDNGVGNFYLKPNGFIAFSKSGELAIIPSSAYRDDSGYNCAIQSGPMLISDGNINAQFNKNSKNLNFRIGVGICEKNGDKYAVFAISNDRVSFYEFALLFQTKFKCKNALNVESGGLCSMHLPNKKTIYSGSKISCKYLLLRL